MRAVNGSKKADADVLNLHVDDFAAAQEFYHSNGWTDGLPRVVADLASAGLAPVISPLRRLIAGTRRLRLVDSRSRSALCRSCSEQRYVLVKMNEVVRWCNVSSAKLPPRNRKAAPRLPNDRATNLSVVTLLRHSLMRPSWGPAHRKWAELGGGPTDAIAGRLT
jgi:hypothetical protein